MIDNSRQAFLELVRAGLWEKEPGLLSYGQVSFEDVYRLAQEQSVFGLVAAGIEQYEVRCRRNDEKSIITQDVKFAFIGQTMKLEQRNREMNRFVACLFAKLRTEGIYALLVKGQGVAQCYDRPLWRVAGDVDLLLDADSYEKAKNVLIPFAEEVDSEDVMKKHLAFKLKSFEVELHGRMPFLISDKVDKVIDFVIKNSFSEHDSRDWEVNNEIVRLPNPDNDVVLIFTHFLHHFFIEGVGIRQICDWCRVLWTYRKTLNLELLEQRIRRMGLITEWKVFAAFAVNILGMPLDTMPFYEKAKYDKKALRVLNRIMMSGNMGHNNDLSYRVKYKGIAYIVVSLWRRFKEFVSFVPIFPLDAPKFFVRYVFSKIVTDYK